MIDNIFIPKKLKIGFQKRSGTYTGKLAYVIYYDEKNKLRKETSWESWRDKKISPLDIDNSPISGFVLNKKVGGVAYSSWDARNTYVRVYDPRDFEFEITIPNLLYILENANSIKGKGLEGDFVYGWDRSELLLIPTSSPEYEEISKINELRHNKNKIKSKDLILGATYRHKSNSNMIYMGRFDKYDHGYRKEEGKNRGLHYFFILTNNKEIRTYKSLGDNFIEIIDSTCASNYAKLFEKIEKDPTYSYIDESKTEYIAYDLKDFEKIVQRSWNPVFFKRNNQYIRFYVYDYKTFYTCYSDDKTFNDRFKSIEEIFTKLKPCYQKKYLANGKLYSSTKVSRY